MIPSADMMELPLPPDLSVVVSRALHEDTGRGDATTRAVVPADVRGVGRLLAREPLVLCGMPMVREVFFQVDPRIELRPLCPEGHRSVGADETLAELRGPLASLLTGERVALNFLQRLSGVATHTRAHVDRLDGAAVRLVDTRKTTPGLRSFEKYAVRVGGGHNHRLDLSDGVMIKDNHIAAVGGIRAAVRAAQRNAHHLLRIQVEVEDLAQAREAIAAGATVLLLDNFAVPELAKTVRILRAETAGLLIEASGGIRLDTLAAVAGTGVDVISCGGLVHQARWVDLSLELDPT